MIAELPNCRTAELGLAPRVWSAVVAIAMVFSVQVASACTMVETPGRVRPNFTIQVRGFGKPIAGAQVTVAGQSNFERRLFTNADGDTRLEGVPAGVYRLAISHPFEAATLVEVVANEPVSPNYVFSAAAVSWPSGSTLKTRQLRGRIVGACAFGCISITAFDGLSGAQVGNQAIGESFDFGGVPSGFYMLRVAASDIPVEVTPTAKREQLVLGVGGNGGSCGPSYVEMGDCSSSATIVASELHGTVVDVTGAVIQNAKAALMLLKDGQPQEKIASTFSGPSGEWRLSTVSPGNYSLGMATPGFTPVEVPIDVRPGVKNGEIRVTLGVFGGCSKAELVRE